MKLKPDAVEDLVGTDLRAVRKDDGNKQDEDGRLGDASLPRRKWLGHAVPAWVDHGVFFVTINCRDRKHANLLTPETSHVVKESALHYHEVRWWLHVWVTMPDHIHALLSFPRSESMVKVVSDWKRFTARKAGIEWQKGFFDHRLRHDEAFMEKVHYIRMNPVRKGLVQSPEEWPYAISSVGRDGSPSRPNEVSVGNTVLGMKQPFPNYR